MFNTDLIFLLKCVLRTKCKIHEPQEFFFVSLNCLLTLVTRHLKTPYCDLPISWPTRSSASYPNHWADTRFKVLFTGCQRFDPRRRHFIISHLRFWAQILWFPKTIIFTGHTCGSIRTNWPRHYICAEEQIRLRVWPVLALWLHYLSSSTNKRQPAKQKPQQVRSGADRHTKPSVLHTGAHKLTAAPCETTDQSMTVACAFHVTKLRSVWTEPFLTLPKTAWSYEYQLPASGYGGS
jgi:hypothetical protein